jgi:hypothetical protein
MEKTAAMPPWKSQAIPFSHSSDCCCNSFTRLFERIRGRKERHGDEADDEKQNHQSG